ncbi:MAG: biopolymer transporter ExbD [Spirochaetales bacterium]|nr:biopolymer transporter ExbD [Spirochaetales bacterium]
MQFKRRLKTSATVDLVPMIDVVFQLVVFFMVSSTFILTPGININLPESTTSEPVAVSRLVITVAGENEIYINKDRYSLSQFAKALGNVERKDGGNLILEGDAGVDYRLMVRVLDELRKNGFYGVNLRTRETR